MALMQKNSHHFTKNGKKSHLLFNLSQKSYTMQTSTNKVCFIRRIVCKTTLTLIAKSVTLSMP